jgi:hypothetical protein
MHRNNIEESLTWTSRWRVVGVFLSFVSSSINETATYLGKSLIDWDEVVQQEIAKGKSDAIILLNSREMTNEETDTNVMNTNEVDDASLSENENGHLDDTHDDSIDIDNPNECEEFDALEDEDFTENDYLEEAENEDILFAGMNWAPV